MLLCCLWALRSFPAVMTAIAGRRTGQTNDYAHKVSKKIHVCRLFSVDGTFIY